MIEEHEDDDEPTLMNQMRRMGGYPNVNISHIVIFLNKMQLH